MSGDSTNDNDAVAPPQQELEAHGQAAMLLVESLIHGLIEQSVISVAKAVEIVDVATEVRRDIRLEQGETSAMSARSILLLEAIGRSLRHDLPGK